MRRVDDQSDRQIGVGRSSSFLRSQRAISPRFQSKKIFERIWSLFDKEEPPEAMTQHTTWSKVLGAAVVQGVTFKITRAAVDRADARGIERLTGVWPGEKEPDEE